MVLSRHSLGLSSDLLYLLLERSKEADSYQRYQGYIPLFVFSYSGASFRLILQ